MQKLVEELGRDIPNVRQSVLSAMSNVRPSHLMDRELFDFSALASEGASPVDAREQHDGGTNEGRVGGCLENRQ